ncbi:RNA 3'-terminal phosphate cyclase/enolpyruvate transferase [Gorgonomyces haynaldii]|nr:RNA 3'-terminal phosphate cyclase/enolpyruvate transferase [Gorgonomyces haynaldii]
MNKKQVLTFEGHLHFRQRLLLSLFSGKAVRINQIRPEDDHPGLRDYEASFIRLLEKVTNGSIIEINYTGTSVYFVPGIINGGTVQHDCPKSRAVGYFLEPMVALGPFGKQPLQLTLSGITNDNVDTSVDLIRTVYLPQLMRFGIEGGLELKILKRGARPLGGGQVRLSIPNVRQLKAVQFVEPGLVKRIRGIAYCTRISPQMANRMQESARSFLTRYIPDVYIYTDVFKGEESGLSPGYALSLVAETDTNCLISTECAYQPRSDKEDELLDCLANEYSFETPEDLGSQCARQLLTEISKQGSVDTLSQWINLLFIGLGPEDVGKLRIGSLTPFTIQFLRDMELFLGVRFKITPDKTTNTIVMSSLGVGYVNVNKKVT